MEYDSGISPRGIAPPADGNITCVATIKTLKEILSRPFVSMSVACEKMVMLHFGTFHLRPALWSGAFQLIMHRPSSKLKEF